MDIGFRGARYLPHVGDDERNRIIDFFASAGAAGAANAPDAAIARLTALTLDVRTNVSYGRKGWSAFLNRCRATIGAESGSVYLTRDDDILSRTESELGVSSRDLRVRARLRPVHRYLPRPVKNALRRGADRLVGRGGAGETIAAPAPVMAPGPTATPRVGAVSGKCVSSRHFDAIGTETCQILFPGRYNDLLEPDRHYLRLETDFSNLGDVLDRFGDPVARRTLVEGAREWALDGQTYAHRVRTPARRGRRRFLMCGIAGLLDATETTPGDELEANATGMAATMAHRGPDDAGVWADAAAGVALGFRRLSIVDLTPTGHQPMTSRDGRYVLVFNGELYNYRALRAELEGAGAVFSGTSDTEVLLEAIAAWGVPARSSAPTGCSRSAAGTARPAPAPCPRPVRREAAVLRLVGFDVPVRVGD